MKRALVICFALAGCEQQPSMLDDLPDRRFAEITEFEDWAAIEERALPLSVHNDLLQQAVAIPARGSVDERAAALIAWMDAGGSVPIATTAATLGHRAFDVSPIQIVELVNAKPDDDRLFEAALYAASKMRRDGTGYVAAMLAHIITNKLSQARPVAPSFAAKYAPTDEEVFRLIAAEAMWVRRTSFEYEAPAERARSADLAMWRTFANAPRERAAFLAFIDRTCAAHPKAQTCAMLRRYADRMFDVVDRYQVWLRGPPP
jgi:hypothetical protein